MAKMALEGVRVGDWTIAMAGPTATMWLGVYGAEVIKIESREGGDPQRDPILGNKAWWETCNYNKKSFTVDLKKEKGREVIYRLAKTLDIFVTNQLPDTVEKLGMDYDNLLKYNPQLIYGNCSVFGTEGPRRLVPALDGHGQAVSGLMMTNGVRGDPPTGAPAGIADVAAGFSVTCATILALFHRERTGEGQRVEGSQLQGCMNIYNLCTFGQYLMQSEEQRQTDPNNREPFRRDRDRVSHQYLCKDDIWVMIGFSRDKHWTALCKAIGQPELAESPKFATREARTQNQKELAAYFEPLFASKTLVEWEECFRGVDCSFSPINRLQDLPHEPQVIANELLFNFDHPVLGPRQYVGPPFQMDKTPGTIRTAAPVLGKHTDEILMELGYSAKEILKLHEDAVV